MKHTCPDCGCVFDCGWDGLPAIAKCNLCLALANAELLAIERYPDQGEQALRHAKFVRDSFRTSKGTVILRLH